MRNRFVPFALAAALVLAACSTSPTEPGSSARQALTLQVDSMPMGTSGGSLSVFDGACGCAAAPVIVTVNGQDIGSASDCGSAAVFPMTAMGSTFMVSARSKDAAGNPIVSAPMMGGDMMGMDDMGFLSLSVKVACSGR
jgi:hypothetical protein